MPNWVYNGLTIEGNPESVKKMMEQLNQPYARVHDQWNVKTQQMEKQQVTYPNPIFSFWNIVKPTDMATYELQKDPNHDDSIIDFKGNNWYDWNVRNWGTKWDVAVHSNETYPDTTVEDTANGENHVVHYNFNTAWSRPMSALINLSSQYPDLLFTLSYEEETGWGGECEILRGVVISESEYENMCRDCDATDQMEYCENDCGEICGNCHWLGEADLDAVAECQTHKIYLDTKVPEYRKVEA